jgi:DNA-binding NtrC family response regulator
MKSPLRILHLEDDPNDVTLVQSTLETGGIPCTISCVQTRDDFAAALKTGGIDLILSDFSLPACDGLSALKIAHTRCPDVPFILVSGILGEERAIDALKSGATDYVLKQRLSRLVPAVRRAMQEVEERVKRKLAERTRDEYSRKLQLLSRRLVKAQETERRRLAGELHNKIGQVLTVAQLNLHALLQSQGKKNTAPRLKENLEMVVRIQMVSTLALNLRGKRPVAINSDSPRQPHRRRRTV